MSERIIIYRLGSLGDTIVALPCFHKIAERFPGAERLVLTNFPVSSKAAPIEAILSGSGLVHGSIAYPVGLRSPGELLALRRKLRATGATTLVYLTPPRGRISSPRDYAFFRFCGLKKIIGAPFSEDLRLNRVDPITGVVEPECERLARTIAALGPLDLTDRRNWDLSLTVQERATADQHVAPLGGRPLLAINMGGKVKEKDWGMENWRELLRLSSSPFSDWPIVVLGSAEDEERAASIAPLWKAPVLNLCGRLTPRESAAVLEHARIFIGHDSGPLHLAYVAGCPTVSMFGLINKPRKWYPYIGSNEVLHDVTGVEKIAPARVMEALSRLAAKIGAWDRVL